MISDDDLVDISPGEEEEEEEKSYKGFFEMQGKRYTSDFHESETDRYCVASIWALHAI